MKIELKDFQQTAAKDIMAELDEARAAAMRGKSQAVVLAAPTGSGKTITVAQVIDYTFGGGDGIVARPDTVFLWLSDSPELNIQSKNKLLSACDELPFHKMVTIDSDNFTDDFLHPGHVYFINTQLLGKDKLLTKEPGDRRNFTFWQTVANTITRSPENFILIIDEAHRGATASDRNRTTIMQKFIIGSTPDGLPPVPVVLGISATPQRFTALLGTANRTQRPINIDPEEVRDSGLLKDLIIVHNPASNVEGDLTLLEAAAKTWMQFSKRWGVYCEREQEKEIVRPILVVQVADGTEGILTRTNLEEVVRVIERQTGKLGLNEIVHCFQEQSDIQAAGRIIRKSDASRVQDNPDVKVVLFKTALSTGWDCPRAEVMMSFRTAHDPTSIAQLVGRMIRTPLARRIDTDEVLNTVELFLPHYDADALKEVLQCLRNPEDGLGTRVETTSQIYSRNTNLLAVIESLGSLPNYSISKLPKMSDVKRLLRLSGLLVHEGVADDEDEEVRELLLATLKGLRDKFSKTLPEWNEIVTEGGQIDVDVTLVSVERMDVSGSKSVRLTLSEENIEQLYDAAGRLLAAGEGLHRTYWKKYHDKEQPNKAKLELVAVLRQPESIMALEQTARSEFDKRWAKYKEKIKKLSASTRNRFNSLIHVSGKAALIDWEVPENIVEKREGKAWEKHLFCDDKGMFHSDLNTWEVEILQQAMKERDFVGWLRNLDRRQWALCIPYDFGGVRPFYPDFIIVRQKDKNFIFDVYEPHDDSRVDTLPKAIGMAKFSSMHGDKFGRLVMARKKNDKWQFVDMNDRATRERVEKMQPQVNVEQLFS